MADWTKPILNDDFAKAVTAIQKRAENQTDWAKLVDTYVHTDLALRAGTHEPQLVLGRRGTGKTHMFRYLQEMLGRKGEVTFYVDCRTLGSGIVGLTEAPERTAAKYFRTLLNEIGTNLLDMAMHMEAPLPGVQQKVVNTLVGLTTQMEPSGQEDNVKSTFN